MITIFTNTLGKEEVESVEETFNSQWIGFGPKTKAFENEFGKRLNANNCLMFNSASAAALISLKALGIGPGDEVIISTINFIACANSVIEVGATPVFADVDLSYFNILPSEIKRLRTPNTKAIIILHYGGHPSNMDEILEECKGLYLIEDSANSIDSKYNGKNCGTLGDAGFFSFDAMKILSTGDGGALILKDAEISKKASAYRFLGLNPKGTSGTDSLREQKNKWWEIDLEVISNRFLMNDIAASIGLIQLQKLDGFIKRRKEIWNIYQNELKEIPSLELPPEPLNDTTSTYYLYWLKVKNEKRTEFAHYMINNGIYCTFRYYPLHLIKLYGINTYLRNSELINETAINIPLHQNLSNNDVDKIIETIKKYSF